MGARHELDYYHFVSQVTASLSLISIPLDSVNANANLSPPEIDSFKTVSIRATRLHLMLQPISLDNHSKRRLRIDFVRRQMTERTLSIFHATLTDKPVRRLRSKRPDDQNNKRPEPLRRERRRVRPVVVELRRASDDTVGDQLARDETEIDPGCQDASQRDRADLRRVGGGDDDVESKHEAA